MRLLHTYTLRSEEFFGDNLPPYAILSHTWGEDECTFNDVANKIGETKLGYRKLLYCANQAKKDGLQYLWMDTCCIDKTSSAELSEAINSMFRWYHDARECYAYLDDISQPLDPPDEDWVSVHKTTVSMNRRHGDFEKDWKVAFQQARWFTRGWTLQELIAPKSLSFFSREWQRLGDKNSLGEEIQEITGINREVLQGRSLSHYSVEERFSWAEKRMTTRVEDEAYCLLGIFDVHMPLLYGEGRRAFQRLAEEIAKTTEGYKVVNTKGNPALRAAATESGSAPVINLLTYLVRETTHHGEDTNRAKDTNNSAKGSISVTVPTLPFRDQNSREHDDSRDNDQDGSLNHSLGSRLGPSLISSQLRILTLDAGIIGDRLEGRVQDFDFSNAPSYYALSYTWGDEPDLHPMFLNGAMRLIRSNLFHALQRVRLRSGPINIWIDSICINQEDEIERNSQVRQMADIYRNAAGVMVWLGEKGFTSNMAMDLITKVVQPIYSWKGPWWQDYGFVALAQILERPWFRRRWVLQEAALSSNTTIYCGDRQVYMSTFSDAVNLVRAKLSKTTPLDMQMNQSSPFAFLANFRDSPAVRLLDIIETIFRRSKLPLETLVDLARFSDTTDHRDTIFSLLSLARDVSLPSMSPQSAAIIEPDYSKTVLDVYADFILHCIHHSGSLDIICRPWAPIHSNRHAVYDIRTVKLETRPLPSWIATRDRLPFGDPSLRLTHRVNGRAFVDSGSKRVYNCHFNSKPEARLGRDSKHKCDGSLYIKGFVLGKVVKTSMRMANSMITKECLQLLASFANNASLRPFSVPDVIWRTLCADRDDKGDPAPTFYRSAMSHLLQLSSEIPEAGDVTKHDNFFDNISSIDVEELLDTDLHDHVRTFLEIVRDVVWNRRTFQALPEQEINDSSGPFVGLIPQSAKVGDRICVLYGCSVPVVLRQKVQPDGRITWQLIGDAYVDGIMDGELIEPSTPSWLKSEDGEFELQ
jgi:heterokaryon incompatibility protein (HET)